MTAVHFDAEVGDEVRRQRVYAGELFVYSPTPGTLGLCELARSLLREAFGDRDPEMAQHALPVERYAAILAAVKPTFIHHPDAKRHIQRTLTELGCDLDRTFFDVPRLRTSTSHDYLSSGIAYAFHPHRDTWYSAPFCQLNWWIPVYGIEPENCLAFHPRYWSRAVENSSPEYDYYEWNATSRREAARHIKSDTRKQPKAEEEIELEPDLRVVCRAGGIVLFSGAQMHSTVRNTSGRTRISVDFRTVHLDDVLARRGARNLDSACTGTTLRDYLRGSDLSRLPEEIVRLYDDRPTEGKELIYRPPLAAEERA